MVHYPVYENDFFFAYIPDLGLEIGGEMNLAAGIQVAQLALKHRQNKKQQQRIIVFAGRYVCLTIFHANFKCIICSCSILTISIIVL